MKGERCMTGMIFIAGLGYVLAAFFGGLLLNGRERRSEKEKKGPHKAGKAGSAAQGISEEQRRSAEQSLRQWQNFLTYDGTQQSGR